jgi:hypothetical protein
LEEYMKNRERQRENRRCKEEKIDIRDYTGVLNPTPYFAVLNIRNGYYYAQKHKSQRKEVAANGAKNKPADHDDGARNSQDGTVV